MENSIQEQNKGIVFEAFETLFNRRSLRSQLSTHQVVTVRLPTTDGQALTIRRDTRPEQIHRDIYQVLRVPKRIVSLQSSDGPKIVTECARQPT